MNKQQNKNYVKVIKLDINENTKFFLNCIDQEIRKQQEMAKKYPEFVLEIKESKYEEKYKNLKQWIEISITYKCSSKSQSIIKYKEEEKNQNQKIKICRQLFKICAWMQKDLESAQGNIKPSNIIVDRGQVLLTDFGSQRTFYKNYCADITTMDEQIQRYRNCLFYSCPKILEIYKQNSDSDLSKIDLNQLNFLQNPLQAICADIFSIGIIIIDILSPVGQQDFNNVTPFYGFDKKILNNKLQELKSSLNNNFSIECLETLLGDNLQQINLYDMYESMLKVFESQEINQQQNLDMDDLNINIPNKNIPHIPTDYYYNYNYEYSSMKLILLQSKLLNKQNNFQQNQIKYSNGSIIDFNKYTDSIQYQSQRIENSFRFQQITVSQQQEISQQFETFKKIPRDQQINYLFNYNEIIKMKNQGLQEYKENLEKLYFLQTKEKINYFNKTIIENNKQKILNAYMQVEWREGALNMIGQQNDVHDALVFYLTYDEFIAKEKNILIDETKKQERKNLNQAIQSYRQSGIIQEQYLKYFPISLLENGKDDKIIEAYIQKNQQKIKLGIEQFDFNKILIEKYFSYKFQKENYFFRSKIEYDQLTQKEKISYMDFLKKGISGNSSNKEIFEKAQFEIYEMYKDYDQFKREERKYDHNLIKKIKKINNIEIISETVQKFCEKHVKFNMKFSFDYKVYFRELKIQDLENHHQIYKNKQETCYYKGEIIDYVPNGFGYAVFNKITMLVGLFRNNQFISGWSIVQKQKLLVKYITFSIGDFKNGWLQGKGIEKEYKVIESQANQFVFFQLQSKQQGQFQEGKLSDETQYEYNPHQPNENRTYNVENFQKILQPRQSNSNVQVDQV